MCVRVRTILVHFSINTQSDGRGSCESAHLFAHIAERAGRAGRGLAENACVSDSYPLTPSHQTKTSLPLVFHSHFRSSRANGVGSSTEEGEPCLMRRTSD